MRHRLEADAAKASSPPCDSYTRSSLSAPARSWGCFRRSDGPFRHAMSRCSLSGPARFWRRCFPWCHGSGACCSCNWSTAPRCPSPGPGSNTDRAAGQRRGALSRAVYILCPTWFDNCADARRAAWDFGGTWLSYLIGVVWGGVLIVAFLYAPEAEFFASPHEGGAARARFRARDVWPRLSDYWASLMLLAIPAIALSLVIMAMRRAPTASRHRSTLSISGRWGGRHNKSTRLNQTATVWLVRG